MSKVLAQLLDKTEQDIKMVVAELEKFCGYPSEDVRLLADNNLKLCQKITQLGLDPDDTTNEELYHSLLARFGGDAKQLDRAIGADIDISLDRKMGLAINLTKHLLADQEVWALKPSVAKQILRAHPPKKLMRLFNYRSIDSLLKREVVSEIYLVAPIVESSTWNKSLAKSTGSLSTANWTRRALDLVKLSTERLGPAAGPASLTASSKLVGAIALWPSAKLEQTSVLNLSLLLSEAAEVIGLKIQPRAMANLHPVLNWWADNEYLLAGRGGDAISFNLKDLAFSHLQTADYQNRSLGYGRQSFWGELMQRYKDHISEGEQILSKFTNKLNPEGTKLIVSNLPAKLAEQYVEV